MEKLTQNTLDTMKKTLTIKQSGGKGSGNFGHAGRPGKVGGSSSDSGRSESKTGKDLYNKVIEQGGFTYQPIHDISPTDGYMVSPYSDREKVISTSILSDKDIAEYIVNNRDLLQKSDHFLGGWIYEENCYLDISIRLKNKSDANRIARENNQIAFFDLGTMTEITTNQLDLRKIRRSLMSNKKKTAITFTGPKNKSFEAYKEWLQKTTQKLGAKTTMTNSEIESSWKKFWSK